MVPPYDANELEDQPLEQEIVLLGELMAAAAQATDHLEKSQIDEVLDDDPAPSEPRRADRRAGQVS